MLRLCAGDWKRFAASPTCSWDRWRCGGGRRSDWRSRGGWRNRGGWGGRDGRRSVRGSWHSGGGLIESEAGAYFLHIDTRDGAPSIAVTIAMEDMRHETIAVALLRHHEIAPTIKRGFD